MKKIFTLFLIAMIALPAMNVLGQSLSTTNPAVNVLREKDPPPMPYPKQLNINVFLQGLYNISNGNMNQCKNADGVTPYYSGTVAEIITVELHDANNYSIVIYSKSYVSLNQNGTTFSDGKSYIEIPYIYGGSYFITVKSRNHIETTSAAPVSFANNIINYNFTTAATQAYGSNLKLLNTGVYGVYSGDVNGDGLVNTTDRSLVHSALLNGVQGYSNLDVTGDGSVTTTDRSLVHSAVLNGVSFVTP